MLPLGDIGFRDARKEFNLHRSVKLPSTKGLMSAARESESRAIITTMANSKTGAKAFHNFKGMPSP